MIQHGGTEYTEEETERQHVSVHMPSLPGLGGIHLTFPQRSATPASAKTAFAGDPGFGVVVTKDPHKQNRLVWGTRRQVRMMRREFIDISVGSNIQSRFKCGENARGKRGGDITKVTGFPEMGRVEDTIV